MKATGIDVACFGELLWDLYEAEPRSEKEPLARTFRRELGGASANVAVALARLGIGASVVGAVGTDRLGDALRQTLEGEGIDTSGLARLPGPTGITFVTRDARGIASFSPHRSGTADTALDTAKLPATAAKAPFVVLGTSTLREGSKAATDAFLAAAQKAKAVRVVDLNVRPHLFADEALMRAEIAALVKSADVVRASEDDLGALAGKRGLSWLEEHAKGAVWVLTRGENGAAALGPHGQVTAPTKRVRCADATGAGDAFTAGIVAVLVMAGARPGTAAWKDSKLWTRALEFGHLLGAKAVSAVSATAGLANLDDLVARLEAGSERSEPSEASGRSGATGRSGQKKS